MLCVQYKLLANSRSVSIMEPCVGICTGFVFNIPAPFLGHASRNVMATTGKKKGMAMFSYYE